jgi:hypothetical protein
MPTTDYGYQRITQYTMDISKEVVYKNSREKL